MRKLKRILPKTLNEKDLSNENEMSTFNYAKLFVIFNEFYERLE